MSIKGAVTVHSISLIHCPHSFGPTCKTGPLLCWWRAGSCWFPLLWCCSAEFQMSRPLWSSYHPSLWTFSYSIYLYVCHVFIFIILFSFVSIYSLLFSSSYFHFSFQFFHFNFFLFFSFLFNPYGPHAIPHFGRSPIPYIYMCVMC